MPKLILIRHGQSQWNLENRFTGWWDVDVTEKGAAEAWAAGELMRDKGIAPDVAFTSVQTRAIKTLNLALEAKQNQAKGHPCPNSSSSVTASRNGISKTASPAGGMSM